MMYGGWRGHFHAHFHIPHQGQDDTGSQRPLSVQIQISRPSLTGHLPDEVKASWLQVGSESGLRWLSPNTSPQHLVPTTRQPQRHFMPPQHVQAGHAFLRGFNLQQATGCHGIGDQVPLSGRLPCFVQSGQSTRTPPPSSSATRHHKILTITLASRPHRQGPSRWPVRCGYDICRVL